MNSTKAYMEMIIFRLKKQDLFPAPLSSKFYRLSRESERERRSRLRLRVKDLLRGLRDLDLKY